MLARSALRSTMSAFAFSSRSAPLVASRSLSAAASTTIPFPTSPLPESPEFSSGPCKKRPGYDLSNLPKRNFGRSHRSKVGKATLKHAIDETKR